MKETEIVEKLVMKERIKKITCDFCGKTLYDRKNVKDDELYPPIWIAGTRLNITFGYGSDFDLMEYFGHICDNCFKTILKDKLQYKMMRWQNWLYITVTQ